jgi:hypothetical protein
VWLLMPFASVTQAGDSFVLAVGATPRISEIMRKTGGCSREARHFIIRERRQFHQLSSDFEGAGVID